jgi:hypothetical protein
MNFTIICPWPGKNCPSNVEVRDSDIEYWGSGLPGEGSGEFYQALPYCGECNSHHRVIFKKTSSGLEIVRVD